MASNSSVTTVRKVTTKLSDGTLDTDTDLGATFVNVLDVGRSGETGYSLDQFLDHYINFMKNTTFVYTGVSQPSNTHMLWVDTGHSQSGHE